MVIRESTTHDKRIPIQLAYEEHYSYSYKHLCLSLTNWKIKENQLFNSLTLTKA